MRHLRIAALGLLLAAASLPAEEDKECLALSAAHDTDISSPTGIRVTVTGRNNCSRDIDGSRWHFKVIALGSGGSQLATESGRFGGTVAAHGRVETKVFLLCDPELVRSIRVEAQ